MRSLVLIACLGVQIVFAKQNEERISFMSGDIKLSGLLILPKSKAPFPAIAVTHGSGREGKADQGYRSMANTFANAGFAVLIFDKRGVGDSEGKYVETPDLRIPTSDLLAAVALLKLRPEIDRKRIGVYGHSQGAWVATHAAASDPEISFLAVSCGGAIPLREQVLHHMKNQLIRNHISEIAADSIVGFASELYPYLASGKDYDAMAEKYSNAAKRPWFQFFLDMHFTAQLPPPSMLEQPVFDFFKNIAFDPAQDLQSINIPTIVLLADHDEHVPSKAVNDTWKKSFHSKSKLLDIEWMENEDHYCFARANGVVVFKDSFAKPLLTWLKKR